MLVQSMNHTPVRPNCNHVLIFSHAATAELGQDIHAL